MQYNVSHVMPHVTFVWFRISFTFSLLYLFSDNPLILIFLIPVFCFFCLYKMPVLFSLPLVIFLSKKYCFAVLYTLIHEGVMLHYKLPPTSVS